MTEDQSKVLRKIITDAAELLTVWATEGHRESGKVSAMQQKVFGKGINTVAGYIYDKFEAHAKSKQKNLDVQSIMEGLKSDNAFARSNAEQKLKEAGYSLASDLWNHHE